MKSMLLVCLLAFCTTHSSYADDTKTTNSIGAAVNDSYALRKFGAPLTVIIKDLAGDKEILVVGVEVNDPSKVDVEHSKIICNMGTIAYVTGKQLELTFVKFEDTETVKKLYVRSARIK